MTRHFLSMFDFTPEEILALVRRAKELRAGRGEQGGFPKPLAGKTGAMIFEKA